MKPAFEHILTEALDALEFGDSIEEILARYAEYCAELEPVLQTATLLTQLSRSSTVERRHAGLRKFLQEARVAKGYR